MTDITPVTQPTIENVKENIKQKLWRRSHSVSSVDAFDVKIRRFDDYLTAKSMTYYDTLKSPLQILDDFAAWLDNKGYAANYTRNCVSMAKTLLRRLGAEISSDDFREKVTLPKQKSFGDDKVNAEQARRLLLACKHAGLKLMLMIIKDTMARPAEVLGLALEDIHIDHEPAYITIKEERAKSDVAKEPFITPETAQMAASFIKNMNITDEEHYIFLDILHKRSKEEKKDKNKKPYYIQFRPEDETQLQRRIQRVEKKFQRYFTAILQRPEFADLNKKIKTGKSERYKYHIYSFKKFCYTMMSEVFAQGVVNAIKGDKEGAGEYYRKSREERAKDFAKVISKLSIFTPDPSAKIRKEIDSTTSNMNHAELSILQEFCSKLMKDRTAKEGLAFTAGSSEQQKS